MNKPQRSRSPIKKAAQQFTLQPLMAGDPRYVGV
jgi:hypothetical protein